MVGAFHVFHGLIVITTTIWGRKGAGLYWDVDFLALQHGIHYLSKL
jgi:hypothetical protein